MITTLTPRQPFLPGIPPQEIIRTFRSAYAPEQVQEELWRFMQPRLLASFKDLNPDTTNKLIAFYENLEILLSAVYQLPDLSAPPTKRPAVNPDAAGGTRHG
jgi:hypothetical protein